MAPHCPWSAQRSPGGLTRAALLAMSIHANAGSGGMLDRYLEIEALARQMLGEARAANWNGVALRQQAIRSLADRLQAELERSPLSHDQRRERLVIARRLLRMDADIRRLASPGCQTLDALFGRVEHRVDAASQKRAERP
ncbi:MAG: hypothetical protein ABS55_00410 [Lautropia sp. SCN 70-15]|nr:MAG: hypothetical protein ABS55_00410 [Lautropia sp. SCN 70-15]